jgi:hypothetical protein
MDAREIARCGGYIAANSHHGIANARPENLLAVSEEAHRCRYERREDHPYAAF